jgi:TP901 family phage tail tape measure protein
MSTVAVLGVRIEIDQSQADAVFTRLSSKVEDLADSFQRTGARMRAVGSGLTQTVTVPLTLLGGTILKLSADFEKAMNRIAAVTQSTGAEFDLLRETALEMGYTTMYSARQAAGGLEELVKAGLDAPAAIAALPAVLDLAQISGESLAETATQLANTLVQFNLPATEAARVANALARAANASTIDVHDLGQSLKYSAIYASAFGLNIEDTAGALALFGNVGVRAEMAGTALRNVMERLANPTMHKGMRDAMKDLGVNTWKAADGSISLVNALGEILKAQDPVTTAMQMFGVRAGPVMVKLVQDAQKGGEAFDKMKAKMLDMSVTAKGVADTMNKGLLGQLTRLKNIAEGIGTELGAALQPTFERIVAAAERLAFFIKDTLVPAFNAMPQGLKDFIVYAGLFAAAIGPVLWFLGSFITTVGGAMEVIGGTTLGMRALVLVTGLLEHATAALGGALAILADPLVWIPALIAAVVLAVRWWTGSWEETINVLSGGLLTLEDVVTAWELLKMGAVALYDGLKLLGEVIWNYVLVPIGELAVELYNLEQAFRAMVLDQVVALWNTLSQAVIDFTNSALGKLIGTVAEYIAVVAGWSILIAGVTAFYLLYAAVQGCIGMVTLLVEGFQASWTELKNVTAMVWDFVALLGGQMYAVLTTIINGIGNFVSMITAGAVPATTSWADWTVILAETFIKVLLYAIEKVIEGVHSLGSSILQYVDFLGVLPGFEKFGKAALKAANDAVASAKAIVAAAREAAAKSIAAAKDAAAKIGKIATSLTLPKPDSPYDPKAGGGTGPTKEQLADLKKMQELVDQLTGQAALAKMQKYQQALAQMPAGWKLTEKAMKDVHQVFEEAMDVMAARGLEVPREVLDAWLNTFEKVEFSLEKFQDMFSKKLKVPIPPWTFNYIPVAIETALNGVKWENVNIGPELEKYLRDEKLKARMQDAVQDLFEGFSDWGASVLSGQTKFMDAWKELWGVAQNFAQDIFKGMLDDMMGSLKEWVTKVIEKGGTAGGALAGGIAGAVAGYTVGKAAGKTGGILAGAASGAAVGAMYGNIYGAAIGAAVGAFAGWWGGKQKEKEMRKEMQESREELIKIFDGMENLSATAKRLGIDIEKAFSTKDMEEYGRITEQLQAAVEKEEAAVKKLGIALENTATKGLLLSQELLNSFATMPPGGRENLFAFMQSQVGAGISGIQKFMENAKISTLQGAQAISGTIMGLYEEIQRQGGSPTEAFTQIQPLLDLFAEKMKLAGFEGSTAFSQLQILASLAADEIAGPLLNAVAGLEQGLTATFNLGLLNQESFAGFAEEMLKAYQQMEVNGKGGLQAMMGMRGGLQKLWELSTDFGYTLSEQQQQLVDYAEQGGLIGDKFRPATDRMISAIDALVQRLDKFIEKLEQLPDAGKSAANELEKALSNIRPDPIHQDYYLDPKSPPATLPGGQATQTGMAVLGAGGIVTHPTRALIGERGPEAVIPLSGDLFSGNQTTNIFLDGDLLTRVVTKRQPGVLRAYGVMR